MAKRKRTFKKPLTDKERDILCLLTLSEVEIASRLYRSTTAIHQSIKAIYKKLQVNNRAAALIKAIRQGDIDVWDIILSTDEF